MNLWRVAVDYLCSVNQLPTGSLKAGHVAARGRVSAELQAVHAHAHRDARRSLRHNPAAACAELRERLYWFNQAEERTERCEGSPRRGSACLAPSSRRHVTARGLHGSDVHGAARGHVRSDGPERERDTL